MTDLEAALHLLRRYDESRSDSPTITTIPTRAVTDPEGILVEAHEGGR